MPADGVLIDAAVERGKAEGTAGGDLSDGLAEPGDGKGAGQRRGRGIPVVITNRGGMGRVRDTRGGGANRPYVWGDNLTPQKARILLMLALTRTREPAELQRIFDEY